MSTKQDKFYESLKQTQINTFSDGLNMDLHPLTTPNTILTDCVNGTMITYNDNEFVLQNARGNSKIDNGNLPEGYIPLAMKEHGGIIYIVSRNIDGNIQIGTYPSTSKQISIERGYDLDKKIKQINGTLNVIKTPAYASTLYNPLQYYFTEDFDAICSPDQYIYESPVLNRFLKLNHFLIDKNGNKEKIELKSTKTPISFPNKYKALLAYQLGPVEIDSFDVINTDKENKFLSYYFQMEISDEKILELLKHRGYNLAVHVDYKFICKNGTEINLIDILKSEYEDIQYPKEFKFKFYLSEKENYNNVYVFKSEKLEFNDDIFSKNEIITQNSIKETLCPIFKFNDGKNGKNINWNSALKKLEIGENEIESFKVVYTPIFEYSDLGTRVLIFDNDIKSNSYAIEDIVFPTDIFTTFKYNFANFENDIIDNTYINITLNLKNYFSGKAYPDDIVNTFNARVSIYSVTNTGLRFKSYSKNITIVKPKSSESKSPEINISAEFENLDAHQIYLVVLDYTDLKRQDNEKASFILITEDYFQGLDKARYDKILLNDWLVNGLNNSTLLNDLAECSIISGEPKLEATNNRQSGSILSTTISDCGTVVNQYFKTLKPILYRNDYKVNDEELESYVKNNIVPYYKITRPYIISFGKNEKIGLGLFDNLAIDSELTIDYTTTDPKNPENTENHELELTNQGKNASNLKYEHADFSNWEKKSLDINSTNPSNKPIRIIQQECECKYLYEYASWGSLDGIKNNNGYGKISFQKEPELTFKYAWEGGGWLSQYETAWKPNVLENYIGIFSTSSKNEKVWTINFETTEKKWFDLKRVTYNPIKWWVPNKNDDIIHGGVTILNKAFTSDLNIHLPMLFKTKFDLGSDASFGNFDYRYLNRFWWLGVDLENNTRLLKGTDIPDTSKIDNWIKNMALISMHSYIKFPVNEQKDVIIIDYKESDTNYSHISTKNNKITNINSMTHSGKIYPKEFLVLLKNKDYNIQSLNNVDKQYGYSFTNSVSYESFTSESVSLEDNYTNILTNIREDLNNHVYSESELMYITNEIIDGNFYPICHDLNELNFNDDVKSLLNNLTENFKYDKKYDIIVDITCSLDDEFSYYTNPYNRIPFNVEADELPFDIINNQGLWEELKSLSPKFIKKYGEQVTNNKI